MCTYNANLNTKIKRKMQFMRLNFALVVRSIHFASPYMLTNMMIFVFERHVVSAWDLDSGVSIHCLLLNLCKKSLEVHWWEVLMDVGLA